MLILRFLLPWLWLSMGQGRGNGVGKDESQIVPCSTIIIPYYREKHCFPAEVCLQAWIRLESSICYKKKHAVGVASWDHHFQLWHHPCNCDIADPIASILFCFVCHEVWNTLSLSAVIWTEMIHRCFELWLQYLQRKTIWIWLQINHAYVISTEQHWAAIITCLLISLEMSRQYSVHKGSHKCWHGVKSLRHILFYLLRCYRALELINRVILTKLAFMGSRGACSCRVTASLHSPANADSFPFGMHKKLFFPHYLIATYLIEWIMTWEW